MKLLFYIPGLVDGGAERVMATLASQLAARGHEVSMAVDFRVDASGAPLSPAVRLIELAGGHGASIRTLAQLLAKECPDIAVAAIASCSFKLVLAAQLARFYGLVRRKGAAHKTGLVLTYHGFEEYKTGGLSWLGTVLLPVLSRLSARTVAVSASLKADLKQRWRAAGHRLVHIYNPVTPPPAPADFAPPRTAQELEKKDNIILSVGRLVPGKRFDLLITAFKKISDPTAKLFILGDGPERETLKNLANELGLQDRVTLPGFTPDTGHYYAKAKCFALTSEHETFGLVLIEAMSYGLPVLSTSRGGPSELLNSKAYGALLGPDPTADEVAKALDQALARPGDPLPRMERARAFDTKTGVDRYEKLFRQILKERTDGQEG